MSVDATIATWKLGKEVTATQKLLLLSLADRAGEEGKCWPSIKRIMSDTNLDRHTIIDNRKILIEKKLIEMIGEMKGRTKLIPVMRLTYIKGREGDLSNDDRDDCFNDAETNTVRKLNSVEMPTGNGVDMRTVKQWGNTHTEPKSLLNLKEEPNTTTSSSNNFCSDYKALEMDADGSLSKEAKKAKFKKEALEDRKCISKFNERFSGFDVTIEQLYDDCCDYWSQKDQMVFRSRFLTHLSKCPTTHYPKINTSLIPTYSQIEREMLSGYQEYVGEMKASMRLNLIPRDSTIMGINEWNSTHITK